MFSRTLIAYLIAISLHQTIGGQARSNPVSSGWQEVTVCGMKLVIPKDLKQLDRRGIDSCVARFESEEMSVGMDVGLYGSPITTENSELTFSDEQLKIDGKKARIVTYERASNNGSSRFFAKLYIVVSKTRLGKIRMTHTVNMWINVNSAKELESANTVFRSIRFVKSQ